MTEHHPDCDCKIGRSAEKYGLTLALRQRREDDDMSLRDLAEHVNVCITESVLDAASADVAGDSASVYAALVGDDVSASRRVKVQDRLAQTGIDVDEVEEDYVSYQSVRHHLQNCAGVDTSRKGIESIEEGREVVDWALEREAQVIERTLRRLGRIGVIDGMEFDVATTVTVTCADCGQTYRVGDLLDEGGCSC